MRQTEIRKPDFYYQCFYGAASGWIYAVQEDGTPLVKVGVTGAHVPSRVQALQREWRAALSVVAAVHVPVYAKKVEYYVHKLLAPEHIEREWFYLHMSQDLLESLVQDALGYAREELEYAWRWKQRVEEARKQRTLQRRHREMIRFKRR